MTASPETDECHRLNDSGILIPVNATASPPISPTSPTFKYGHFVSAWNAQRLLNLEGEALSSLSALYILKKLIIVIGDIELRQGSHSSADSPLYGATLSEKLHVTRRVDQNSYRPCHYFDLICGSGFGGISAVMLGVLRLTIDEAIDRYRRILLLAHPVIAKGPLYLASWDRRPKNSKIMRFHLQSALEERGTAHDEHHSNGGWPAYSGAQARTKSATMKTNDKMCRT